MTTELLPQPVQDELDAAARVLAQADTLARISASSERIDRRYLSNEHKEANRMVGTWMQAAGLTTSEDAVGNIVGLKHTSGVSGSPKVIIGSHLDTIPDAGRYDGILGVLCGIEAARVATDCTLEVIGFAEEEGVRFGTTLMTSRARAGSWDDSWWSLVDDRGTSLQQAFEAFGLAREDVPSAKKPADAYIELHIEQGPVLESLHLPVGVVTGIAGAKRCAITIGGQAGHAGTVPMDMRQDALLGAAHCTVLTRKLADQFGVTATVGQFQPIPGAVNVIAGEVSLTLDVRSLEDALIESYLTEWQTQAAAICAKMDLSFAFEVYHSAQSAGCDPAIQKAIADSIQSFGLPVHHLPSGAGHDAMAMRQLCPVGMIFLRCLNGVSHHPDESVSIADVAWGLATLKGTLANLTRTIEKN